MALLILAAATPATEARDALRTIDDCIGQLDPELDVGFEKIAAHCPELAPVLTHSPLGAWLPSDWDRPHNELTSHSLEELRALIVTESARKPPSSAPNVGAVSDILTRLAPPGAGHQGWWDRFKAWLREVIAPPRGTPQRTWLGRLIEALAGRGGWFWIAIAALLLVVLLAGTILVSELRAAGVLRQRRPTAAARAAAAGNGAQLADWRLIEAAPPAERPRLLLELIAARLAAQDRLPPARAMTVHELLRAARLSAESDHARLGELAATCEQLRFSGQGVPAQQLSAALARGRELLDMLGTAPA